MANELQSMLEDIDVEDFLCHLGIDFKITHGSSGVQANIRECPRCGGTKWKVYLGTESGLGNCFHGSCQGEPGFNLYTYTRALLGSGRDAYKEISNYVDRAGWLPQKRRVSPVEITEVKLPSSYPLPIRDKNLSYLANRGISSSTAKFLGLRFCKKGRFDYQLFGENKWQIYDERVIIPVLDENGSLVTFQGRDITGRAEKKYLFPPGLAGTGRYLYNANNCVGLESIVIAEGAFDVASILEAFKGSKLEDVGVTGSFGKHLSTGGERGSQLSQLLFLKQRGLRKITMMWDGEKSALDEACKTALMIKSYGFIVRVASLPIDKDPNEMTREEIFSCYKNAEFANPISMARMRLRLVKSVS